MFEIKLVFAEVEVTLSSSHPPTGTNTGSRLNPQAFVPSERPYSQGFTWAGFTQGGIIENTPTNKGDDTRMQSHLPAVSLLRLYKIGFASRIRRPPHVA